MEINEYFNDLLGKNFFVEDALVVGPYPSEKFFRQWQDSNAETIGFPRSKLTVVADDGWDRSQLDKIDALFSRVRGKNQRTVTIRRVAALNTGGLVHAKIYFFTLKNHEENRTKKILLIGSANASTQGFGLHAETFVSVDLADIEVEQRRPLTRYLDGLTHGENVASTWFTLGRNSWVTLPEIRVVSELLQSGFDSWLRRGRLCYKYRSEQSFGKLSLRLKKPLPKTALELGLSQFGFGADQDSQNFSREYIAASTDVGEKTQAPWRGKYFVETYLGFWTSSECYREMSKTFTATRADERRHAIAEIAQASKATHAEWLEDYEISLTSTVNAIIHRAGGPGSLSIEEFFVLRNGGVDVSAYRLRASKKLELDQARAHDEGFAERFISQYAFNRVPQPGEDFENFALDFCQTLIALRMQSKLVNRLAQTLRELVPIQLADSPEELLKTLREEWSSVGQDLIIYFRDGKI
jgi:hypothetical protein